MEILYLNNIDSTHRYIQEYIKLNGYKNPLAIFTSHQTSGIGSRDNEWIGKKENFYLSFVIYKDSLPLDLELQSASIYFSFILKDILSKMNSQVWLKWPNDFYIDNKKIGGTITSLKGDLIYCGIGINLIEIDSLFGSLDINIDIEELLKLYFSALENYPKWKHIFSKYLVEFNRSKKYLTTIDDVKTSLEGAILNKDGSLLINKKKVFSLR
ncbi:MAG: biotin--[acetyl-CoA-carboxylase] ligase [Arcobacteraceae bacterium]|nr:biotin--[acetyl-CoA-carboxylase] ligase [Arcobacteraceae bacterium]